MLASLLKASLSLKYDLDSWTPQTSGTTNALYDVLWTGSLFVAGGLANTLRTSPDSESWTARSISVDDVHGLTIGGGYIAAVGHNSNGAETAKSTDGVTWSTNGSTTADQLFDVTWSSSHGFLAVGKAGGGEFGTLQKQATINTSWSSVFNEGVILQAIAWSGSIFVTVGPTGNIKTSTDGETWTQRAGGLGQASLYDVVWTGSQFVAVGNSIIRTSPDGITWTTRATGVGLLNGILWTGDYLIAVGDAGVIRSSKDGISWTLHASGTTNNLRAAAWSGSQIVVVGDAGTILTSP